MNRAVMILVLVLGASVAGFVVPVFHDCPAFAQAPPSKAKKKAPAKKGAAKKKK